MKIFEFEFYDNYCNRGYWFNVLANSVEEAEELLRKYKGSYFIDPDINFCGCIEVIELDKPKVL